MTAYVLLRASGFYSDATGAELTHRVVLGVGKQRAVRPRDDVL